MGKSKAVTESDWVDLADPVKVFKGMVPGKIRLDEKHIGLPSAHDVNVCFDGNDARIPFKSTVEAPNRWICKLQVAYKDPVTSVVSYTEGSGLLIGERFVLTAAHVLMDGVNDDKEKFIRAIDAAAVVVIPGLDGRSRDRSMPFGWVEGQAFRMHPAYRKSMQLTGSPPSPLDYAVIRLGKPIGAARFARLGQKKLGYWGAPEQRGATRIRTIEAKKLRNVKVNLAGYPGDKCIDEPKSSMITGPQLNKCRPADRSSVPWYAFDRITDPGHDPTPFGLLQLDHDVAPGMSGGPVWLRWRTVRTLIGINHACGLDKDGKATGSMATRLTPTVIRDITNWTA